jgi:hypothetical protein
MLSSVEQVFPFACVALEIAGFKVADLCDGDLPVDPSQEFALTFDIEDHLSLRLEYVAQPASYRIVGMMTGASARPEAMQMALRLNFIWGVDEPSVFSVDPGGDLLVLTRLLLVDEGLQADDLALAIAQVVQCMMAVSQSPVATAADLADRLRFQSAGIIQA